MQNQFKGSKFYNRVSYREMQSNKNLLCFNQNGYNTDLEDDFPKEVLMSPDDIQSEIEFEDKCGVNDLLTALACYKVIEKEIDVYFVLNDQKEVIGWRTKEKQ